MLTVCMDKIKKISFCIGVRTVVFLGGTAVHIILF